MDKRFSVFDARARFSELIRTVMSIGPVVITQRGIPVIRMIPYEDEEIDLLKRLEQLTKIGQAQAADRSPKDLPDPVESRRSGALRRFLSERE